MIWNPFFRVFVFVKPYRFWVVVSIMSALVGSLLNIVFADLIKNLTDAALNVQGHTFLTLIFLTSALVVVAMIGSYISEYATTLYKTKIIRDLRNQMTAHIQRLPISYIEQQQSGDLVSRLNSDISKIEEFIGQISENIYQPFLFVSTLTYLLWLNWKLCLITSILIPISSIIYDIVSKPLEDSSKQLRELLAMANIAAQDMISGIAIVKAFNLQDMLSTKYRIIAQQIERQGLYLLKVNSQLMVIWMVLRFIPQLVLPLYGGYLILQGELTVGGLLAAARLIWGIFLPVEAFLGLITRLRETAPALRRIIQILDEPIELVTSSSIGCSDIACSDTIALELHNVTFEYEQEKPILNGLDLHLGKNEIIALVGPSGSGKSTIFKLICGFYHPQRGVITLLGNSIHQTSLATARANIAFMSQDTYLFPTTISENIRYGRLGATQEEIVAAAKAANAHNFIMELPHGYETHIGERGNRLSGGQRQRVALARVILKDAAILLLDEPTAALDGESEALVNEGLLHFMRNRTVLIIAHRLSTIQKADRVLVLDQGHIIESGTHKMLQAKDSLYRKLYLKQIRTLVDNTEND